MESRVAKSIHQFTKVFIEHSPEDFYFELFSLFPSGCCEYASLLLARFLREEHSEVKINILTGKSGCEFDSLHIWLRIGSENIDITAKQFDSALPDILITQDGGWHEKYEIIDNKVFDNAFDANLWDDDRDALLADYQYLSSQARAMALYLK